MDGNITYCNGKGCVLRTQCKRCVLRTQCKRYQDGQRIIANTNGDTDQYAWMDNCNPENREMYINNK